MSPLLLPLLALSSGVAIEGVAEPAGEQGLTGKVDLSFANATGNTENLTLIFGVKAELDRGAVVHKGEVGARYAEAAPAGGGERTQTQEAAFLSYQIDGDVSERGFVFARTRYDYDGFSGFEHRAFLGAGAGWRFYETEELNWTVSGGPGVRWTRKAVPDPVPDDFEREETEASVYVASEFAWDVNDKVGLTHDARVTTGGASTTLENEAGLQSKLTEKLAARFSYLVRHETDPAEGRQATDTLLSAGIAYTF